VLPKFSIMIMLLVLSGIGFAQDLPDAPSVAVGAFPTALNANPPAMGTSSTTYIAPPAAKGPWIDPQIADGAYWSYTSALVGSTALNVEMTARCSERGTCLTWIFGGTSAGSARLRLYAYTLPADAAISYLAYTMKRKGKSKWWVLPPALVSAANLFSAGRSYSRLESGFGSQRSSK
jgi:hypothetical protein